VCTRGGSPHARSSLSTLYRSHLSQLGRAHTQLGGIQRIGVLCKRNVTTVHHARCPQFSYISTSVTQHKADHDWSGRDTKQAHSASAAHAVLSGHTLIPARRREGGRVELQHSGHFIWRSRQAGRVAPLARTRTRPPWQRPRRSRPCAGRRRLRSSAPAPCRAMRPPSAGLGAVAARTVCGAPAHPLVRPARSGRASGGGDTSRCRPQPHRRRRLRARAHRQPASAPPPPRRPGLAGRPTPSSRRGRSAPCSASRCAPSH